MKYKVQYSQAGNVFAVFDNLEDAQKELRDYEELDMKNGEYEEGWYEIAVTEDDGELVEIIKN